MLVFSWKLLHDMISTRDNALKMRIEIDSEGVSCSLCSRFLESSSHLFITCEEVVSMWYMIFKWLGWSVVSKDYLTLFFICFSKVVIRLGLKG